MLKIKEAVEEASYNLLINIKVTFIRFTILEMSRCNLEEPDTTCVSCAVDYVLINCC